MIVLQAVNAIVPLFLMGFTGYVLAHRGWFTPENAALLPRLVMVVALPPFFVSTMLTAFARDDLLHLVHGLTIPALALVITFAMAAVLARLLRLERSRRGVFSVGFSTSNTVFIGIPVNLALFGSESLPYVLVYFMGNSLFFWTIGNYALAVSGSAGQARFFSRGTLRQIFSPPLLGALTGILLVLLGVRLPAPLMETARILGGLTTPLAVIYIGVAMHQLHWRDLRPGPDLALLMVGRFVVSPLVMLLVTRWFDLPRIMHDVFIIQSCLPVMTNVALLAGLYKADVEYASLAVSLSTVLALLAVPVYMLALS